MYVSELYPDQPDDEKVDYAWYYYEDEDGNFYEDEEGEHSFLLYSGQKASFHV